MRKLNKKIACEKRVQLPEFHLAGKPAFPSESLRPLKRSDIKDGGNQAAITCALAAIRRNAHEVPDTRMGFNAFHDRVATCGNARCTLRDCFDEGMCEFR